MQRTAKHLDTLDIMLTEAVKRGLLHHGAEDQQLDGRSLQLQGRQLLNFGSCSYLGLELDTRLKDGVIEAVERYGTQFSSSRAYVSAPQYEGLEELLRSLFGSKHVLATPSTT